MENISNVFFFENSVTLFSKQSLNSIIVFFRLVENRSITNQFLNRIRCNIQLMNDYFLDGE